MIEFSAKTRVPVKMWVPDYDLDAMAIEQVINVANHPEVNGHVALMPDAHGGFGVPIGCVFPTEGVVIPNAVGVDQGCGMAAVRTGITFDAQMDQHFWDGWAREVAMLIPTGFNAHSTADPKREHNPLFTGEGLRAAELRDTMQRKGPAQLGTLGGGNHFLEAQVDEEGLIWLMVHSGSRGTGNQLARHYYTLAVAETEKRGVKVAKDLASLSFDEGTAHDYMHDLQWSMDFARASRGWMLTNMLHAMGAVYGEYSFGTVIDCMHNYAVMETVEGRQLMVHRKGATDAHAETPGIIPGSMGSPSYIVMGKGNPDSYASCSHGAGRKMGRNVAKKTFDVDIVNIELEDAATFTTITKGQLDEAPGAYKDIETVIGRQTDLIDIVHTLRPLRTVKGDSRAKDD